MYAYEMTGEEHAELASALRAAKGKVAISSYDCKFMDELYAGWNKIEAPSKLTHSVKKPRREILWTNYAPKTVGISHSNWSKPVQHDEVSTLFHNI